MQRHDSGQSRPDQLELFTDSPFSLRLKVDEALRLFVENYWRHLPSYPQSRKHLERIATFFHKHYLDTVTQADVEAFRRWLKGLGLSIPTINKAHMILSRLFSKFKEYKRDRFLNGEDVSRLMLPETNPASLVRRPSEKPFRRKEAPIKDQIVRLASFATQFGYHDTAEEIWMLYWTRLRPSDLKRITQANVDFRLMALTGIQNKTITTTWPSGVPYFVPMTSEIERVVRARLGRVKPGSRLFPSTNYGKRWKRIKRAADLWHVHIGRDLRRGAATFLIDNNIDPQTVAEGLGHTTLRMLPTYSPRTEAHLRAATELLEKS